MGWETNFDVGENFFVAYLEQPVAERLDEKIGLNLSNFYFFFYINKSLSFFFTVFFHKNCHGNQIMFNKINEIILLTLNNSCYNL